MARRTGRKTFYEDEGEWIIRGDDLLRRLKKGAEHWNRFRWHNRRYRPSLSHLGMPQGGNFVGFNLSGGKFTGSEFDLVDFSGAKLRDVDAKAARFNSCNFTKADLTHANFFNTRFELCDFTGATLSDAFLVRALFRHCKMDAVDFGVAEFGETDLINVRLSGARGLSTTKHEGPSYIDVPTLSQSLPIKFLRGVGLPEKFITAQPLFGIDASDYHSCFISFSTRDKKFAERLYMDLQMSGVRCWFAPHDLLIGAVTYDEIDRQITRLDKLVIVLSKSSLASQWCEDEVMKAYAEERRRKSKILLPVQVDDTAMKTKEPWASKLRDQRNIGDFRNWKSSSSYKEALKRLLSSLGREQPGR